MLNITFIESIMINNVKQDVLANVSYIHVSTPLPPHSLAVFVIYTVFIQKLQHVL